MAKSQTATFRYAQPSPPYWEVRFDVPVAPAAGAFMLADLGGPWREPLFPALSDAQGFVTWVLPGHPVLHLLPGARIEMLGPLGRGFRLHNAAQLLLVAEVTHLPLLLPLIHTASAVALFIEAPTRALLPAPDRFPPSVELYLATLDGSTGYLGPLESLSASSSGLDRAGPRLLELLAWAECACFACTAERYPELARWVRQARLTLPPDFAQAIISTVMPCGVGACDICRVTTTRGELHTCTDGPVFDLLELTAE